MSDDLGGLAVFVAVAEEKGFRAAGRRLGVSGSAVSQAINQLEARLGIAVFERTTRTVRLTEAGQRLYDGARPALGELRAVEEEVKELGDEPSGTLRLNVSHGAESVLRGPLLGDFLTACPRVRLDLIVTEHTGEIVEAGYDAAVGLLERIEQDMIAIPVSGELRLTVVGAPSYFARHPAPQHPHDLADHVCLNWTPAAGSPPYRWEFTENGKDFTVNVDARVLTTDPDVLLRLAIAGVGLAIIYDQSVRAHIDAGELVPVLEAYCQPFPGFYLYFPRRRYRSAALRAFIDFVRREVRR
jgi:DNA-binding transcriptional LysR family regulator